MSDSAMAGLREENTRLLNDLSFQLKLNNVLETIRTNSLLLSQNCKCIENKCVLSEIKHLNNVYNDLKRKRNHISIIGNKSNKNNTNFDHNLVLEENQRTRKVDKNLSDNELRNNTNVGESRGQTEFNFVTDMLRMKNDNKETKGTTRPEDSQDIDFDVNIKCEPDFEAFEMTISSDDDSDQQMVKKTKTEKEYQCYICNEVFDRNIDLDLHLAEEHNVSGSDCLLCGFNADSESQMIDHRRRAHTKSPRISGNAVKSPQRQCDQSFKDLLHVNVQNVSHLGETPFKCPVDKCGQWFKSQEQLRQHQQVKHTMHNNFLTNSGDRPHNCPGCNKAFRYEGSLKTHNCPKGSPTVLTFNSRPDLTLNNDLSLKCELCNKFFESQSELMSHKRNIHRIEPLPPFINLKPGTSKQSYAGSSLQIIDPSKKFTLFPKRCKPNDFKQKANNELSPYALFVKDFAESHSMDNKTLSKTCSQIWKKMSNSEKEKYNPMSSGIQQKTMITQSRQRSAKKS